jgi:hypothetical protein
MNVIQRYGKNLLETRRGLLFLLVLSAVLRGLVLVCKADTPIADDGLTYIAAAQQFAMGNFAEGLAIYPMAAYPLLIAIMHWFVPHWVTTARLISLGSLSLVLIPLYLLAEDLFDRRVAFWSCVAFILSPEPLSLTLAAMRDEPFVLVFTLGVYFAQRALRSAEVMHLLGAVCLSVLSIMFRLEGIIIFPVYLLILVGLAIVKKDERKTYLKSALIWTALTAVFLTIALATAGLWVSSLNRYSEYMSYLRDFFRGGFLDNYARIYARLGGMEEFSPFGKWGQNFAEFARRNIPVIYMIGVLESLIKVTFISYILALCLGLKRTTLSPMHVFIFALVLSYLAMVYYFVLCRDFLDRRFLLPPAIILYPWIGMGIQRSLTWRDRLPYGTAVAALAVLIFIGAPLSKVNHLFRKENDSIIQAGKWLAEQENFRAAKIICTDDRILFYACGESFCHQSEKVCRKGFSVDYECMGAIARGGGMDMVIIYRNIGGKDAFADSRLYRKVKEFRTRKKIVIIYCALDYCGDQSLSAGPAFFDGGIRNIGPVAGILDEKRLEWEFLS